MQQFNFLPEKVRLSAFKSPNFGLFRVVLAKSWWLPVIFILAVGIGFFGYPTADALYRTARIIPAGLSARESLAEGNLSAFGQSLGTLEYHFARLQKDSQAFTRLNSWPLLGRAVQSAHAQISGTSEALAVFAPIGELLSQHEGGINNMSAEHRRQIILHLKDNAQELSASAAKLEQGSLPVLGDESRQAAQFMRNLAYVASDLPELLGVDRPARYLVVLANNLEIRPGGGFIGTYALLTVRDGEIVDLAVRDSYQLPGAFNTSLGRPAPAVFQRYVGVPTLAFRDANWWPDYPTSAREIKAMYIKEGGEYGHEIKGVVTVTTEILKKLVEITGPVTVGDITFTKDNAVSELQKEVEITFWDRGIPETRRKDVVGDLAQVLYARVENFGASQNAQLFNLTRQLLGEKHMALYFENAKLQDLAEAHDWHAGFKDYASDTLMVVDANLVGYKTEALMTKSYTYAVREEQGKLIATLKLNYKHRATFFSPLIHNYRTYVRVYVPEGSRLLEASLNADVGRELDRTVFGALLVVPVGEERSLSFTYELGPRVAAETYSLLVQKQLGAYPTNLIVDLNFGNVHRKLTDIIETNTVYEF